MTLFIPVTGMSMTGGATIRDSGNPMLTAVKRKDKPLEAATMKVI